MRPQPREPRRAATLRTKQAAARVGTVCGVTHLTRRSVMPSHVRLQPLRQHALRAVAREAKLVASELQGRHVLLCVGVALAACLRVHVAVSAQLRHAAWLDVRVVRTVEASARTAQRRRHQRVVATISPAVFVRIELRGARPAVVDGNLARAQPPPLPAGPTPLGVDEPLLFHEFLALDRVVLRRESRSYGLWVSSAPVSKQRKANTEVDGSRASHAPSRLAAHGCARELRLAAHGGCDAQEIPQGLAERNWNRPVSRYSGWG
jgi:hypothetical protein